MKDRFYMFTILVCLLAGILGGILLSKSTMHNNVYVNPSAYDAGKLEDVLENGNSNEFELPGVEAYQEGHTQEEIWEKEELYYGMTDDELNLLYAIVMQEGGEDYYAAEAVMSTIMNRVNNQRKWSWAGSTIIEQITYPQQFCYSIDDYWVQYLDGNVPISVKTAVRNVIEFGPTHDYDCFRGYYVEGAEQIGDNWFYTDLDK